MVNIYFKISQINRLFVVEHINNLIEFEKLPAENRLELLEVKDIPFRFELCFISDITNLRMASRGFNDITISDMVIYYIPNSKPIFTFKKFLPHRPLDPIVVREEIAFTIIGNILAVLIQDILNRS